MMREFNKLSPDFREILVAMVKRFKELTDVACKISARH